MQTSCGSPCYAAPELVISDGMYVGSAVDIWSCGVILYAMLAGYLPFDDDPANPDGDNINLLYKYIVNTPLSFPDYISAEARDFLSLMLVPDPKSRADIQTVMNHRWLRPSAGLFNRTLGDLEHAAMEQHQQKRLAYQKQMKAAAESQRMARSQSARTDGYAHSVGVLPSSTTRSRSNRDYNGPHQQQQVPLYETSGDQPVYSSSPTQQQASASVPSRRGATSQIVLPTTSALNVDDDPFSQTPSREKPEADFVISPISDGVVDENARRRHDSVSKVDATPTSTSKTTSSSTRKVSNAGGPPPDQGQRKKKEDFRHTIQVEYNDNTTSESQQLSQSQSSHRQPSQEKQQPIYPVKASEVRTNGTRRVSQSRNDTTPKKAVTQTTSSPSTPTSTTDIPRIKALPPTPQNNTPRPRATSRGYTAPPDPTSSQTTQPTIEVTAPLSPTSARPETNGVSDLNISVNGTGSQSAKTHRTGTSLDKIGFAKLFGGTRSTPDQTNGTRSTVNGATTMNSRQPSESDVPSDASASTRPRRPSTMQVTPTVTSHSENVLGQSLNSTPGTQNAGGRSPQLLSPVNSSDASATSSKKSRRNTLTVMVEPFSRSIKQRTKSGRAASREPSSKEKDSAGDKSREPSDSLVSQDPPKTAVLPPHQRQDNKFPEAVRPGVGNAASTSKAKKVMDWFRTKSRGKVPDEELSDKVPTPSSRGVPLNASTSTINGLTSPGTGPSVNMYPPISNLDASTSRSAVSTAPGHPNRTPSVATEKSVSNPLKRSFILSPVAKNILRVHHGAVDQTTITSGNPPEVMKHVLDVLLEMGLEVQEESQYKYRCIRPKKRKIGSTGVSLKDGQGGSGLAAISMVGSAASGRVSAPHNLFWM
jgi:protein-serine/threonine kinase